MRLASLRRFVRERSRLKRITSARKDTLAAQCLPCVLQNSRNWQRFKKHHMQFVRRQQLVVKPKLAVTSWELLVHMVTCYLGSHPS
jgi:hypothetical protein